MLLSVNVDKNMCGFHKMGQQLTQLVVAILREMFPVSLRSDTEWRPYSPDLTPCVFFGGATLRKSVSTALPNSESSYGDDNPLLPFLLKSFAESCKIIRRGSLSVLRMEANT